MSKTGERIVPLVGFREATETGPAESGFFQPCPVHLLKQAVALPVRRLAATCLLLSLGLTPVHGNSDRYLPRNDDEIIVTLSRSDLSLIDSSGIGAGDGGREVISPDSAIVDLSGLMQRVLTVYEIAVVENDSRAFGHALALIETWPDEQLPPIDLLVIKADILQHNHEFDDSITVLKQVLERAPANASALRMLPQINLVTGDYDEVPGQCDRLEQAGYAMLALNCRAQLDGLTGQASQALQRVESALEEQRLSRQLAFELHVTAAEVARRMNRSRLAAQHFLNALQLNSASRFAVINYADLLLEQSQYAAVAKLLESTKDLENSLEMQLIHAKALLGSNLDDRADQRITTLEAKMASLRQRGEEQPHKLIADFALNISEEFDAAFQAARTNWGLQKEPSDTLLLAHAALAAGNTETLDMLAHWQRQSGLEDYRLDSVLREAGVQ